MVEVYNLVKLDRQTTDKASENADDWGWASKIVCDGWGEFHVVQNPLRFFSEKPLNLQEMVGVIYMTLTEIEESQEAEIDAKCSGLTNLGNTRFMNSVLQCLTYTVPFAKRILDSQQRLSCESLFIRIILRAFTTRVVFGYALY
ncbi:hypothetical protein GOP47_0028542 [Adiantum capillus-veneris]|nr:hypothetical protein GOP47_0028542 [Adiantum capillus-veneris]